MTNSKTKELYGKKEKLVEIREGCSYNLAVGGKIVYVAVNTIKVQNRVPVVRYTDGGSFYGTMLLSEFRKSVVSL